MANKLALKQIRILASTHAQAKRLAKEERLSLEYVVDKAVVEGLRHFREHRSLVRPLDVPGLPMLGERP